MPPRAPGALLRLAVFFCSTTYINPRSSDERPDLNKVWVELPPSHVALGGDMHIQIHGIESGELKVRLGRDDDEGRAILTTMPISLDTEHRMAIPCGYFSRGGTYYLELVAETNDNLLSDDYDDRDNYNKTDAKVKRDISNDLKAANTPEVVETSDSVVKSWKFEVMWPTAKLDVTPEQIETYPERQVTAIVEFPSVVCMPIETGADFWLELLYCGHSRGGAVLCDGKNTSSSAHVLYSEQMHGFPGRRTLTLRCELFGQAGDYALTLRPAAAAPPQEMVTAFIKADWSDQFVLNVHGGAVFPCGEGVRVLFQYPQCSLDGADRIRVFGRDGGSLRYVAERRVRRGQHTASFDCRLFSERYPEYCFVYVSQAVTGAVADVRMDCLPTLPLSADGGAGAWGPWSPWSACPAADRCSSRTRSRHRFCDSPPPAYGAKYCEGNAVELAACACRAGGDGGGRWAGDAPGVAAEVGALCRCGCVLHLAPAARLLAGSARACPPRAFWLLQAEEGLSVRLRLESVRLPCAGQALRVRDGDSLGSALLAAWDGPGGQPVIRDAAPPDGSGAVELSGGRHVLVELRSSDTGDDCAGGFLAHATQVEPIRNASAAWASVSAASWFSEGTGARAAALALAAAALLTAGALAVHSAHRTRAYQRAADKESLTDSDACSASLELSPAVSGSRCTLLSELAGERRVRPARAEVETRDQEQAELDEPAGSSDASDCTVTPEASSAPAGGAGGGGGGGGGVGGEGAASPLRRSRTASSRDGVPMISPPPSLRSETATAEMSTSISSVSERDDSEKDRDSAWDKDRSGSRASSSSAATLTNGWYSPALSGVTAARVRNPKQGKESRNRRLLRSDLSLTSHAEMEMDYYDYEVNNAGSVPGSYLGMDPAFLVWIPPLDEGDLQHVGETTPVYEEIHPRELLPDPGSNTESPEDRPSSSSYSRREKTKKKALERGNIIQPLNFSITDLQHSPKLPKRNQKRDDIPMKDLTLTRSPIKVHRKEPNNDYNNTLKRVNDTKRETDSDTLRRNDLPDLKFADDSESSSDIKFADDDTPDSNKLVDKFDVKV